MKWDGGHGLGDDLGARGNSLRLAETRLVLDINLVIFLKNVQKIGKNAKFWHDVARFFQGRARPPLFF